MAIFLVVPAVVPFTSSGVSLRDAIEQASQQNGGAISYNALPNGEFLVKYKGTSRQLSDALNITEGETIPSVVLSINSYYGRASTDIWEWFEANWES